MSCTITVDSDMFRPLSVGVYDQSISNSHGWHVLATFNYQEVRISASWTALYHHSWHVPASFESQLVRVSISWAESCLTSSRHFQLLASAYFRFISSRHGWHVPTTSNSQRVRISISRAAPSWLTCSRHFWHAVGAYYHSMNCTIMADMFPPLSIIRKCVFPFHKQHSRGWHVHATFDYQEVRISISWAAPSWLICFRHFWLSGSTFF